MISLTSPVKTAAHNWPAGGKLLALCLASVVLFSLTSQSAQFLALIVTFSLYALGGRVFMQTGAKRLWVLWPFVLIVGVWHVVIGEPASGSVILMRMVTSVALANLVTMTTRLTDMMDVLRWLVTPLRMLGVNTRAIEIAIAMVIRLVPTLIIKGRQVIDAWRARSKSRANWRVVLPLAIMAIDDADHMAAALKARGGLVKRPGRE